MARARNIKPGFCTNEDLAECSFEARLCFALLPMLADREGRMEDRPKRIKGELFRFDSLDVDPLLVELERHGFILRYEVNGLGLIQILAFAKHQNPHHREPESTLPPPQSLRLDADGKYQNPEAFDGCNDDEALGESEAYAGCDTILAPEEPQASPGLDPPKDDLARGSSRVDSGFLIPDSGTPLPPRRSPQGLRFAEFWAAWPASARKVAKADCEKRWKARGLDAHADAILAHVEALKPSDNWQRGYEPAPLTYLNQRRWEDGEAAELPLLNGGGSHVNRV